MWILRKTGKSIILSKLFLKCEKLLEPLYIRMSYINDIETNKKGV